MSSSQQKPTPSLALWDLLFTGEEPSLSNIKPSLTPTVRKKLVEEGLIELEKRGQSTHIIITDETWHRALDDLVVEGSRSHYSSTVLQHLLSRLQQFLSANDISLAEFLRAGDDAAATLDKNEDVSSETLKSKIREAYTKASQDSYNVRVRLTDLRENLSDFQRDKVDRAIGEMELEEELVLMAIDDPQDIKDEDEAAAISISGKKRHIIYIRG